MKADINQYIRNCDDYRRLKIPQDKTPRLLKPLPIPKRPQQYVSMDFHKVLRDRNSYNTVFVNVDRLGKRVISIPYQKTITTKEAARLYITHIYQIYRPLDTIISDQGLQFILAFQNEFTQILGIKLKLSTTSYLQTNGQIEIANQYLDQKLQPFVNYF